MHWSLAFVGDSKIMAQDPGEEDWENLVFISQLLYETSLLVAIKNTSKKKRKIDFFKFYQGCLVFFFFFFTISVVNLSSTIEKFKILVIVLLQRIISDQTCYYYHQLCLWWNLHLLFSRFVKNRDLLGRNAGFSLQQWSFLLCHHCLYAELVWVWEKLME